VQLDPRSALCPCSPSTVLFLPFRCCSRSYHTSYGHLYQTSVMLCWFCCGEPRSATSPFSWQGFGHQASPLASLRQAFSPLWNPTRRSPMGNRITSSLCCPDAYSNAGLCCGSCATFRSLQHFGHKGRRVIHADGPWLKPPARAWLMGHAASILWPASRERPTRPTQIIL
jgi:hypothetical protein